MKMVFSFALLLILSLSLEAQNAVNIGFGPSFDSRKSGENGFSDLGFGRNLGIGLEKTISSSRSLRLDYFHEQTSNANYFSSPPYRSTKLHVITFEYSFNSRGKSNGGFYAQFGPAASFLRDYTLYSYNRSSSINARINETVYKFGAGIYIRIGYRFKEVTLSFGILPRYDMPLGGSQNIEYDNGSRPAPEAKSFSPKSLFTNRLHLSCSFLF